jgi:hypothetical protein
MEEVAVVVAEKVSIQQLAKSWPSTLGCIVE